MQLPFDSEQRPALRLSRPPIHSVATAAWWSRAKTVFPTFDRLLLIALVAGVLRGDPG
jgi:hypothetical protein